MPRARRYFVPHNAWHITHRCHKKEFLLKFARDRRCWVGWLYAAKKRYGLCVLDYVVTSNHIHLLIYDKGKGEISRAMQLVAGQTAAKYNQRKDRKGAFWEDRYHATAVATDEHLARCMVYIDLNMVRAGVVDHPRRWEQSGYREIQNPPERYSIIDLSKLCQLLEIESVEELRKQHRTWVEEALKENRKQREAKWTEDVAIGDPIFLKQMNDRLRFSSLGSKRAL